jgi:phosphoserine phosphatase
LNLDYAFCNILHEKDGLLTGEVSGPLLVEGSKAEILQELMNTEKLSAEECAAVGDGANDISMLQTAGIGVAFNAKPVVKEIADVIIEGRDLRELLTIFNNEVKDDTKSPLKLILKKASMNY